MSSVYISSEI